MTTGYIFLPEAGGGMGTGNILSINGDTSANQFIVGSNGLSASTSGGITTVTSNATALATSNTMVSRDGFASSAFGAVTATTLNGNLSSTSTLDTVAMATVLAGVAAANSATASPTSNTIAKRDGFGQLDATGFYGGDLVGNATNVTGVVAIANGGTGQSNQQAGLNNITDIGSHSNGDVLQLLSGNAQFAPLSISAAAIAAALNAPANTFIFADPTQQIVGYNAWQIDPVTFGPNVLVTVQPNALGGGTAWNVNTDLVPLQDSPSDSWNGYNWNYRFDPSQTNFSIGDATHSNIMFGIYSSYDANAQVGSLFMMNMNYDVGASGTSTGTAHGFSAFNPYLHVHTGMTIDGNVSFFNTSANIDSGAISTAVNWQSFSDFSTIVGTINNYSTMSVGVNIGAVTNAPSIINGAATWGSCNGFNAFSANINVTTCTDFAAYLNLFGTLGTMRAVYGLNYNPNITSVSELGAGINLTPTIGSFIGSGDHVGININLASTPARSDGRRQAISINQGTINSGLDWTLPVGAFVAVGNSIGITAHVLAGFPLTGTDTFLNYWGTQLLAEDDLAIGPFGLGTVSNAAVMNMAVFAGKTVDAVIGVLSGASTASVAGDGGNITDYYAFRAFGAVNGGGATTATNNYLFADFAGIPSIATNNWGLHIVSDFENYLPRLAINTASKKVSSSTVGLEIFNKDLLMDTGSLIVNTAGFGLEIKEGANAKMGQATLVIGTVTVSTTAVTANSRIFVSNNAPGGTVGALSVTNIVAGTSFDINSTSAIDTSTISWLLVEPS